VGSSREGFVRGNVSDGVYVFISYISDPAKRNQFKQFVNTDKRQPQAEMIEERGQERPADWAKADTALKITAGELVTPKDKWTWIKLATKVNMRPSDSATTSVAVKYGDTQLAIFHVPKRGYYATQQM